MASITLDQAERIVAGARAKGTELKANPLTIAVLDPGGHLVALGREDGSSILRPQIATGKAWGALGMGRSSRQLEKAALDRPHFVEALIDASGGRMVPVAGGVLVVDGDKRLIGAVGVTGDTSDVDETCALAGIAAAGLDAIPPG